MPEVWDMSYSQATSLRYPLRPGKLSATRFVAFQKLIERQSLLSQLGIYIAYVSCDLDQTDINGNAGNPRSYVSRHWKDRVF
jgi:hypothetical protein